MYVVHGHELAKAVMAGHRGSAWSLWVRGFFVGERQMPEIVCLKLRRGFFCVGLRKLVES